MWCGEGDSASEGLCKEVTLELRVTGTLGYAYIHSRASVGEPQCGLSEKLKFLHVGTHDRPLCLSGQEHHGQNLLPSSQLDKELHQWAVPLRAEGTGTVILRAQLEACSWEMQHLVDLILMASGRDSWHLEEGRSRCWGRTGQQP